MRRVSPFALLIAGAVLPVGGALAQAYPAKPIRVIVPAQAGASCDTLTRLIGQKVGERLGQSLIVDNRVGASGMLGLEITARAAPDGYTIACGQGGNMVVVPHTYKKVPYDALRDFAPIALIATNYLALASHPSAPFKGVKDLVAYAKANPGKLTFASSGEGAFSHMVIEQLRAAGGFTYLHVPYKGVGQATTELMAGRVDVMFSSFAALVPHVRAGKLRMLAVARSTRAPNYPEYPTVAETYPGFSAGGWFGFVGPAAIPKDVVVLLNREINRAMGLPDVRERMTALGLDIPNDSPESFGELIKSDYVKYGKIIRSIGLQMQ